jgi:hypothetical protein
VEGNWVILVDNPTCASVSPPFVVTQGATILLLFTFLTDETPDILIPVVSGFCIL